MHLNYVCCLLHKYSSFLLGELPMLTNLHAVTFQQCLKVQICVLLFGAKVSTIALGDSFVGVLIRT
jgi:hypothetical protein